MRLTSLLTTAVLAAFLGHGSLVDGSLPNALQWDIYPKHVPLRESVAISYQVDEQAPPFTLSVTVDHQEVEALSFTLTPMYGMTVHTMNSTGRHPVSLIVKWEDQESTLTDDVWVYIPITPGQAALTTPTLGVTPPGSVSANVSISSQGELPTLLTGTIDWGDAHPIVEVNLTDATQPGATGAVWRSFHHKYLRSGQFSVLLTLENPISSIQLTSSVKVIQHTTLEKIVVQYANEDDSPVWSTTVFKTNTMLNFTAIVKTGNAASFELVVNDEKKASDSPSILFSFQKAGTFEVRMLASGEGGKSPALVKRIEVAKPVRDTDVHLLLPQRVVWPPGETPAVVNVTSLEELPTRLTGTVNWGDGGKVTEVDLTGDTQAGATGAATLFISHDYQKPGIYEVTLTLSNPVSRVNTTKTIRVLEHLTIDKILVDYQREADAPKWPTDVFKTNVPLKFTAVEKSGVSKNFTLLVNGENITNNSPSFVYTFSAAGEYNISITSSGEAGMSPAVRRTVLVARPLTKNNLQVTVPLKVVWPPGVSSVEIVVKAAGELPTHVTCTVSWGDGEDQMDTEVNLQDATDPGATGVVSKSLNHSYSEAGTFLLTVNFRNPVSRVTLTKKVRVLDHLTLESILVHYLKEEDDFLSWPSAVFRTGLPLNFTAVILTGVPSNFTLSVEGKEVTENVPSITYSFQSAGNYSVDMRASGEAGVSPAVTITVVVVRPVLDDHLSLNLPDLVVLPPGETTLEMTVSAPEELPTYILGYNVTWGDGQVSNGTDLTAETQPGARGPITRILKHNYTDTGNYQVTLFIFTPASKASISSPVRVVDHLMMDTILVDYQRKADAPPWPSAAFKTGVPLNFTAVGLTGDMNKFTFYVQDQDVASTVPYVIHTFQSAGEHVVRMRATGEAGVSPAVRVTVVLERPVLSQHLDLTLPDLVVWPPGEANVIVTVKSSGELPTNVSGFVSWGDDEANTEVDLSVDTIPGAQGAVKRDLLHIYSQPGDYLVNLELRNSVSRANLTKPLQVLNHLSLGGILVAYENPSDAPERHVGVFKAGVPLNITALIKSGTAEEFTFTVDDVVLTSDTPSFAYTFQKAGAYQVTMKTSGDAGSSNTTSSWVRVATPLEDDNPVILTPELVVFPPGDVNITLLLTAKEELPTNVSSWVGWGDGGAVKEEVSLTEETGAGAMGPLSRDMTHTYALPGEYIVTWFLQNPVSQLNLSQTVNVVQQLELEGLAVALMDSAGNVTAPEGFHFVGDGVSIAPANVKGQPVSYILSVSGLEDLVQTQSNFSLTFDRESDYEVKLVAEGLAGTSNVVSGWVRVRDRLTYLRTDVSDVQTRVGLELTFSIQTTPLLGACLTLDLDDGSLVGWRQAAKCEGQVTGEEEWQRKTLSELVLLTHEYSLAGTYTATVRLFSVMGELVETTRITVFDSLPCEYIDVYIQKNGTVDAPVNMTRADKLWIRSLAEVNCSVPEIDMDIRWRMVRVNDSEEVDLSSVDTSKGVLFLPPRTLHYGLYRATVTYNISMINLSGRPVWALMVGESVVEVGRSELMVVMLKGGSPRIRRGTLQTLALTPGRISYDPDYPDRPLSSYVWWCRLLEEGEEGEAPQMGVVSDPPPSRDAYDKSKDLGGCWGEGPAWMSTTKPSFIIDVNIFRHPYKIYSLHVMASSADGRQGSSTVEVEVVEGDPPTLVSGCSPPWFCRQIQGAQLVNPAKLIIRSGCEEKAGKEPLGEDGCGEVPLQYLWEVFGIDSDGGTQQLDITDVTIGAKQHKLALLDDFWKRYGSTYQLYSVQVTARRPGDKAQGLALQRLQINKAPVGGSCSAEILDTKEEEEEEEEEETERLVTEVPELVVSALVDTVLCNCTGWEDPEGFEIPKYSFFALTEKGEKMILAFGPRNAGRVVLPYANVSLWAAVSDQLDAETLFHIANVDILLPTKEAFDEYMARNALTKAVSARDQTKVDMLLRAENSLKGISLPTGVDYDEGSGDDTVEDKGKAQEANKNMLTAVDRFSTTSMDEVIQVNNILGAVADPLPKESQGSAVDFLVTISGAADKEAPLSQQKDFVAGALGTAANLMKGVNKNVNSNASTPSSEATMMAKIRRKRMAMNESLEMEEEPPYEPNEDDVDASEKVEKMLDVVGSSQRALLESSVAGEEPAKIDAGERVSMAVGFFDAAELEGRVVEVGGAVYVFPGFCAITRQDQSCLNNKSITIGVQMAKWKDQVHGYGGGRDQLSEDSATVQLSLVDSNSKPIPVNDSLEDFIMYIPRAQETISEPTLVEPTVSSLMALSIHNLEVPAPRVGVTVLIRPENASDVEDWVLAWSSSPLNGTLDYTENLEYLTNLTYHPDTGFYELFLDSDTIGEVTGTYYVGVGRYNATISVPQEHPCFEDPPNNTILLSYDTNFDSRYFLNTFTSSCLFFNKELLTWSSEGCKVKGANSSVTVCACNHLSSFGSGFFMMPNTIDFSYVFANAGFTDNLTIYLVLIISLGLYLIGLVYARIMDKKDVEKIGATPLSDNDPKDRYLYHLIVHTGHHPNASTQSRVQILLVGDWDETGVRTINDTAEQKLLTTGAADHFIMATERPLGPLHYLRIWHDNSGKGKAASWFFSYLVVRDIQTGEEFQFISNQWLAVEDGDGQIDRLVAVAGEQQLREYSHVFGKTVEKNLADDHLWFSVFLRPPRSRFTRVQRLSSCMALLYLSMLVNAMFYQKVPEEPGSGGLRLGPLSVSPQALGIGFVSNLIVFPPSFCIIFFFRKSRPRKPKESRLKVALSTQNPDLYGDKEAKEDSSSSSGLNPEVSDGSKTPRATSSTSLLITPSMTDEKNSNSDNSKKRKKKLSLPWWCVIIAWVLCAISIAVAVFFLWAYGIQFGNEKATKWLTALISSIFSSILFTQPVKIYLMAMLLSWILKRPLDEYEDYDDDEEDFDLGSDEELLHGPPTSQDVGSQRNPQVPVGAGFSPRELAQAKKRRKQVMGMQGLMVEILVYLVFLTIILSVSYGSRDPNIFYMRGNIANMFTHSRTITCPPFVEAYQTKHFWCWMREIMVPGLLNTTLYNGEHRPQEMCGTLQDRITFLLGHAVIRQIRRLPGDLEKHPASHKNSEDKRDFGRGWNASGDIEPEYQYRSALELHSFPYDGSLATYSGGGYLVELKGQEDKVMSILDSLETQGWVDEYTKALFLEFAVFNPQVNLFAVTMFLFEFIPGGGIVSKFDFEGLKLLRYHTPGGAYVLASEIAYLLFTLFYTRREYKSIKKLGCSYLKSIWNLMELWVIALSYTAVVFYLLKTSLTYYTLDKFTATKGKKYIRMRPLAFLDEVLGYVVAFQVFIGTLKLLKLLRFNKRIGMLSATLKHAASDIFGFGLLFIVTLVSFVTVFYLNTLTSVKEFSTFIKAAESSFFLINKKFEDIRNGAPVLGPIFYFVFAFIMYWVVFQLLIAIICHSFAKVSQDISRQPNDYEIVEYAMSRMSAYLSSLRPNSVQPVNIPPPRPPDVDSQLRHINMSLDRALAALNRALPPKKGKGK